MKQVYPDNIQKEEDRLQKLFFELDDEEIDLEDFIEKNASDEYKKYMIKKQNRYYKLLGQGIIEN